MSPVVIGLALVAAVLHATWNAALRSGVDRLQFVTVMSFATTVLAIPLALLLPLPAAGCWWYLGASAFLQVVYVIFLAEAYRHGELGHVYPILRGSVPLLVSIGGFLLADQRPSAPALLGILLVSLAIVSLALGSGSLERRSLVLALLAALFVASYMTADALGVRRAGNPQSYTAWIWLVYGALMPAAFWLLRRRLTFELRSRGGRKALLAGLLSFGSYGVIIAALALGDVGPIAALRETSIVFSALIGRVFLDEALTMRRMLVCAAVAVGAVCIALAR